MVKRLTPQQKRKVERLVKRHMKEGVSMVLEHFAAIVAEELDQAILVNEDELTPEEETYMYKLTESAGREIGKRVRWAVSDDIVPYAKSIVGL